MQINSGIAYFGNEEVQGTLKEKIKNAIDSDVTSIQVKNTDIKSFDDFIGYNGSIACYLDDVSWNDEYFNNLKNKIIKLKELGLDFVIVPTMMPIDKYKDMSHDDKLNSLRDMSKFILTLASSDINVGLLNDNNGVYVGNAILPIVNNLNMNIADKIGYAVNISEKNDGGISKVNFNDVNSVNIEPVLDKDGNLVYDGSRSFIGNVYYEFAKFGHMPKMYIIADNMTLPSVNNMALLVGDIVKIVDNNVGGRSNGNVKTRSAPGYHQTGVGDNAGEVGNNRKSNLGFVDCMQLFLVLSTLCLVGVMIAVILVLL